MPEIKKLTLIPKSGLLTQLQSDTIFGHFCWRLRELAGEDTLADFLNDYKTGPVFTLSDGFLAMNDETYFPKPLLPYQGTPSGRTKKEKIKSFLNHKDLKKRKFLNAVQLNYALNGQLNELNNSLSVSNHVPKFEPDLRVSVGIDREKLTSKQGALFSYDPLYIVSDKHGSDNKVSVSVFIKVINEEKYKSFNCEEVLKETFAIGYGKKKSSGYGEFEVKEIEKFDKFEEPENSNAFITLSNYLPSKDDKLQNGYYEPFIKYGRLGEEYALSQNPFKKPIIFLKPGSCFRTDVRQEFYGRCTSESEISETKKEVIQNGIAFTLQMKIS